jgi:hypothetical protein
MDSGDVRKEKIENHPVYGQTGGRQSQSRTDTIFPKPTQKPVIIFTLAVIWDITLNIVRHIAIIKYIVVRSKGFGEAWLSAGNTDITWPGIIENLGTIFTPALVWNIIINEDKNKNKEDGQMPTVTQGNEIRWEGVGTDKHDDDWQQQKAATIPQQDHPQTIHHPSPASWATACEVDCGWNGDDSKGQGPLWTPAEECVVLRDNERTTREVMMAQHLPLPLQAFAHRVTQVLTAMSPPSCQMDRNRGRTEANHRVRMSMAGGDDGDKGQRGVGGGGGWQKGQMMQVGVTSLSFFTFSVHFQVILYMHASIVLFNQYYVKGVHFVLGKNAIRKGKYVNVIQIYHGASI